MTVPARISLVTLGVHDLAISTAFYEALGWQRARHSTDVVSFFITADSLLGLFPFEHLAADANLPTEGKLAFGGITLSINLESEQAVDMALADAVAAGASLLKPASRSTWGAYTAYYADPDGYPWEVAHNPAFAFAPDGSLAIPPL